MPGVPGQSTGGGGVPDQSTGGGDSEEAELWEEALRLNEEWRAANRINMSRYVKGDMPCTTPEARLLKATAATFVFSCVANDLSFFIGPENQAAVENDVNAITIAMSPSNMNFGCTSLALLTSLADEIANHAEVTKQPPKSTVSPEQRMRVLRLKARPPVASMPARRGTSFLQACSSGMAAPSACAGCI